MFASPPRYPGWGLRGQYAATKLQNILIPVNRLLIMRAIICYYCPLNFLEGDEN